jgi:hypothetical protein
MFELRERRVTVPELVLIAGTRVMLGIGLGLLLGGKLERGERRVLGRVLVAIGAATTLPLAIQVLGKR